jgi:hypothetical protein
MTLHVPHLPFSLDPLIAEAKRRMRHRRLLVALTVALLAAGAAAGAYFLLGPGGPSKPPVASHVTSSSGFMRQYNSPLGWSMRFPHRMYVEHSTGGGISFGVDEATVASFKVRSGVREHRAPNELSIFEVPPQSQLGRFPTRGIAVRVLWLQSLGRPIPASGGIRPPLRLSRFGHASWRWYSGTRPRPLQQTLVVNRRVFYVQVWTGQRAPARQRSLLAQIVASISAARAHKQS